MFVTDRWLNKGEPDNKQKDKQSNETLMDSKESKRQRHSESRHQ